MSAVATEQKQKRKPLPRPANAKILQHLLYHDPLRDGVSLSRATYQSIHDSAQKDITPLNEEINQNEFVPMGIYKKIAEWGVFGARAPEEYGGLGINKLM